MNSPTEQHLGAAFRDLVAEQPFIPDVSAIEHRARQARRRNRIARGGIGAGVVAVAAVAAVGVASAVPSAPARTAQAVGAHPAQARPGGRASRPHRPVRSSHWCSWPPTLAAEPRPTGNATLVERETGTPGHASINVWDLYTDNGQYFFSQTKAGLPAQVKEDNNQGDGMFAREIAAATYAATGNLDTAALKMAWAADTTPVPAWLSAQVKNMSAGGLQIDNYVWESSEDALVAGSGNPQVRAGVLRLVSVLPGITVTHGTVDGQPTLTLTAGAAELGRRGSTKPTPRLHGAGLPGSDHHQRRHRHSAGVRRRHGRPGRRQGRLRGDPGQPSRYRRRQVLTGRTDQRPPARPHPGRGSPLVGGVDRMLETPWRRRKSPAAPRPCTAPGHARCRTRRCPQRRSSRPARPGVFRSPARSGG